MELERKAHFSFLSSPLFSSFLSKHTEVSMYVTVALSNDNNISIFANNSEKFVPK